MQMHSPKKHLAVLLILPVLLLALNAFAQKRVYLWDAGAPGFEHLKNESERAQDWWVKNVHNPSITVYLPKREKANGSAVLIFPGGGHRELVIDEEGTKAAKFFNEQGIAAFVLKYRLAREEGSPYSLDIHPKQDAERAMRLIRSRAKEWRVDADRVGVMGFSAGGEVAAMIAYAHGNGSQHAQDRIDRFGAKPNFQILIYPGPLGIPKQVNADAPPTFALVANDDDCCAEPTFALLRAYRRAGVAIEAHFYAQGGHGFNMGDRSDLTSLRTWPDRLADWLADSGYTTK